MNFSRMTGDEYLVKASTFTVIKVVESAFQRELPFHVAANVVQRMNKKSKKGVSYKLKREE